LLPAIMEAANSDPSRQRPRSFPLPVILIVSVLLHAGLLALVRATPPHGSALESPALRATWLATAAIPPAPVHDVPARLETAAAGPVRAPVSVGPPRRGATEDQPVPKPQLPTTVAPSRAAEEPAAPASEAPGSLALPGMPPTPSEPPSPMPPAATAHEARSGWGARQKPPAMPLHAQDGRAAVARAVLQAVRDGVRASLSGVLQELAAAGDGSCEVAVTDDAAAFESTCDSGALAQALAALSEPARQSVSGGMRAIGVRRLGISTAAGQADIALR
jgi:hypothetical protein